ncbi:hypothetical protein A3Q56_05014 [Intoshia linei]|uniref:SRR1-like domain-containing protein n=1 Tax=Intoshia linei TaxID=1819745 RepID=A0A177AYZ9_9BILA|nr:hypothetical protein A3Q56_05014 [Intoshia linei]
MSFINQSKDKSETSEASGYINFFGKYDNDDFKIVHYRKTNQYRRMKENQVIFAIPPIENNIGLQDLIEKFENKLKYFKQTKYDKNFINSVESGLKQHAQFGENTQTGIVKNKKNEPVIEPDRKISTLNKKSKTKSNFKYKKFIKKPIMDKPNSKFVKSRRVSVPQTVKINENLIKKKKMERTYSVVSNSSSSDEISDKILNMSINVKGTDFPRITEPSRITQVVCYGIGPFSYNRSSLVQFCFLVSLVSNFNVSPTAVFFFDPCFNSVEKEFIRHFNYNIIEINEYGKRKANSTGNTLFFMPHCDRLLIENVIMANSNEESLNKVILVGNSIGSFFISVPSRIARADFPYMFYALDVLQEIKLNIFKDDEFFESFNDISIHLFKKPSLVLQTIISFTQSSMVLLSKTKITHEAVIMAQIHNERRNNKCQRIDVTAKRNMKLDKSTIFNIHIRLLNAVEIFDKPTNLPTLEDIEMEKLLNENELAYRRYPSKIDHKTFYNKIAQYVNSKLE